MSGPASSTSTFLPAGAAVSTCAAVPPPAPLPMMKTSKRSSRVLPRTSSFFLLRAISVSPAASVAEDDARDVRDRLLHALCVGRERLRLKDAAGADLVGV